MKLFLKNFIVYLMVTLVANAAVIAPQFAHGDAAPAMALSNPENDTQILATMAGAQVENALDKIPNLTHSVQEEEDLAQNQTPAAKAETKKNVWKAAYLIFVNLLSAEGQRKLYEEHLKITTASAHNTAEEVVDEVSKTEITAVTLASLGLSLAQAKLFITLLKSPISKSWVIDSVAAATSTFFNTGLPQIMWSTASYILRHDKKVGGLNEREAHYISNILRFNYSYLYLYYGMTISKNPDVRSAYGKLFRAIFTLLRKDSNLRGAIGDSISRGVLLSGGLWTAIGSQVVTAFFEKAVMGAAVVSSVGATTAVAGAAVAVPAGSALSLDYVSVLLFSAIAPHLIPDVLQDAGSGLLRRINASRSYDFQHAEDWWLTRKVAGIKDLSQLTDEMQQNINGRITSREERLHQHLTVMYQALNQINYYTLEMRYIEKKWTQPIITPGSSLHSAALQEVKSIWDYRGSSGHSERYEYARRAVIGYTQIFEVAAQNALAVYEHEHQQHKNLDLALKPQKARSMIEADDEQAQNFYDWLQSFIFRLRTGLKANEENTDYTKPNVDYASALNTLGNSLFWHLDEPTVLASIHK